MPRSDISPFVHSLRSVLRDVKTQVRDARRARGWTQRQMADRMGTAQGQYSAWEADERRLDTMLSSVFRAAHVLGLRVEIRLVPRE